MWAALLRPAAAGVRSLLACVLLLHTAIAVSAFLLLPRRLAALINRLAASSPLCSRYYSRHGATSAGDDDGDGSNEASGGGAGEGGSAQAEVPAMRLLRRNPWRVSSDVADGAEAEADPVGQPGQAPQGQQREMSLQECMRRYGSVPRMRVVIMVRGAPAWVGRCGSGLELGCSAGAGVGYLGKLPGVSQLRRHLSNVPSPSHAPPQGCGHSRRCAAGCGFGSGSTAGGRPLRAAGHTRALPRPGDGGGPGVLPTGGRPARHDGAHRQTQVRMSDTNGLGAGMQGLAGKARGRGGGKQGVRHAGVQIVLRTDAQGR